MDTSGSVRTRTPLSLLSRLLRGVTTPSLLPMYRLSSPLLCPHVVVQRREERGKERGGMGGDRTAEESTLVSSFVPSCCCSVSASQTFPCSLFPLPRPN
eukprot:473557-Hanusia_phi.AAC.1